VQLKFGSDGYRGVIGHTLTREALAQIALAVGNYLRQTFPAKKSPLIPVGYDTRFLAREFAEFVARLLAEDGLKPLLMARPCPSPYLAFATRHLNAPLGVQITASHNSPYYCGLKLKGEHGGSMFPRHADLVEALANAELKRMPQSADRECR
jgi:phosphomannomutase